MKTLRARLEVLEGKSTPSKLAQEGDGLLESVLIEEKFDLGEDTPKFDGNNKAKGLTFESILPAQGIDESKLKVQG
jgi:hypothetical protein